MKKLYKNFIFDIILAVLALALGIVMLPPFEIGQLALNILLAAALLAYLVIYLFDKVRRARGTIFILLALEFIVICVLILGLFLQQLKVFNVSSVCATLGLVLWLRGAVCLISLYLTASVTRKTKYSLPSFLLYLLLVSVGAFTFAKPFVSDLALTWIICIFFFLVFIAFIFLAFLYSPSKKKKQ